MEQVYSMPVPQRVNYNFVLSVQNEKMLLENEMMEIREEQKNIENRLDLILSSQLTSEQSSTVASRRQSSNYYIYLSSKLILQTLHSHKLIIVL